jgi:quercetin dioxygenase-like cupin family protein
MSAFQDAMRRVITGDDAQGQSVVIIDGGPSSEMGNPDLGGLFEIWEDAASGPLDPRSRQDLGTRRPVLGPRKGNVQVRWFVINPLPEGVPKAQLDAAVRERFAEFGGTRHIIDQSRHPGMHETHSIDVICLLQGDASLILEGGETRLKPGNVVIQRGTNHAWQAHGGPALLLAVLIDRDLAPG